MTEPRLLFVLPDLTVEARRGYEVRAVSLAAELKDRFVANLVSAGGAAARRRPKSRMLVDPMRTLLALGHGRPLQTALFDGASLAERTVRAAIDWDAQVVIVVTERLPLTTIALAKRFPVVLDVVDSMAAHSAIRASRASALSRWFWRSEERGFARLAPRLRSAASAVIAASATARDHYPNAVVVPNASGLKAFRVRPVPEYDLAFTGNLWYWPNVEAVRVVCEEVIPIVRQQLPEVRVLIAGRNPTGTVLRLARRANVTIAANVSDMGALLSRCRLALAPIAWTPAANLKIMDAIAVGTPVLTFPAAASQLPSEMRGVITCNGAQEMAAVATDLLLGRREPIVASDGLSWTASARVLASVIESVLASGASTAAPRRQHTAPATLTEGDMSTAP